MGSKIYVGGLPYATTESQLDDLFAPHGTVESARVITDKFTGQSRGFGFVEMSTDEEAKAAIAALNETQLNGRTLTVNEAKPQEPRSAVAEASQRESAGRDTRVRCPCCFTVGGIASEASHNPPDQQTRPARKRSAGMLCGIGQEPAFPKG